MNEQEHSLRLSGNNINTEKTKNTERNKLIILSPIEISKKVSIKVDAIKVNKINIISNNKKEIKEKKVILDLDKKDDDNFIQISNNCLICEEKLSNEELLYNFIGCTHGFCNSCFLEYFKEKINNNKVIDIKCPQDGCETIIKYEFIENFLTIKEKSLLDKYKKFKNRYILLANSDIQLCPFPDCESYAKKNTDTKNVTCLNGHQFCLKCLKSCHNDNNCQIENDKNFQDWKKDKKVKQCPRCKYYIEKIDGCNHITCVNCNYEWCWLCKNECKPGHYGIGQRCEGLIFSENPNDYILNNAILYYINRIIKLFRFLICFPFFCLYSVKEIILKKVKNKKISKNEIYLYFYNLLVYYISIGLYGNILPLGFIVIIIMILYWPFQRKMLNLFYGS